MGEEKKKKNLKTETKKKRRIISETDDDNAEAQLEEPMEVETSQKKKKQKASITEQELKPKKPAVPEVVNEEGAEVKRSRRLSIKRALKDEEEDQEDKSDTEITPKKNTPTKANISPVKTKTSPHDAKS